MAEDDTPPEGLQPPGQRLWSSVVDKYDLTTAEQFLLLEACRVTDRLDAIATEMVGAPLTVADFKGNQVANPLMVEARQQQIVLTRLVASLRMPEDDSDEAEAPMRRPTRRGMARGAYRPRATGTTSGGGA